MNISMAIGCIGIIGIGIGIGIVSIVGIGIGIIGGGGIGIIGGGGTGIIVGVGIGCSTGKGTGVGKLGVCPACVLALNRGVDPLGGVDPLDGDDPPGVVDTLEYVSGVTVPNSRRFSLRSTSWSMSNS